MKYVLALMTLVPGPVLAAGSVIPAPYRGEFEVDPAWCGREDDNEPHPGDGHQRRLLRGVPKGGLGMATKGGLMLRFRPWPRKDYEPGFDPHDGIQPPDKLVLSQGGHVLNRHYRRCPKRRK